MTDEKTDLQKCLNDRYGSLDYPVPVANSQLLRMASRGSCRHFTNETVDDTLIETLCAIALASPTKSDLQQRDIVLVRDKILRDDFNQLFGSSSWVTDAPVLLVFCGNNRRQRQLSEWRDHKPFPNDHLDAFFNASVDAGIALSAFVTAAESVGLGCCPISEIRNHCDAVSNLLQLPQHVFPIAGLATGWPEQEPDVSMRLPLSVTVHHDRYRENDVQALVEDYDQRRSLSQPYIQQRETGRFGESTDYGWSEDKARQYTVPQRIDFGRFIRSKGFNLK